MARFFYRQEIETAADLPACRAAVLAELEALGARIDPSNDPISAHTGSQLVLRLVGAYLAPRSTYPLSISVELQDHGERRRIAVETAEAFGLGTLWPAEDRFRAYCQSVLAAFIEALSARLPGPTTVAV
jgi:hypothetical protein